MSKYPEFLNLDDPYIKICIICEGSEEYDYLNRLIQLGVWNNKYFINLVDAKGNGNIAARYQDKYQNGSYDLVFIFCDTDKKPYETYEDIKRKINDFHGVETAADEVVFFGNPCTMQIIIEHWKDVKLKSPSKKINANIINECTCVENYKGKKEQRSAIMQLITAENYKTMKRSLRNLSSNDKEVNSSNFIKLAEYLEQDDEAWIDTIQKLLE